MYDSKNPRRNQFEEALTKKSAIHSSTIEIYLNGEVKLAKTIEVRLLSVNDVVAAEDIYYVLCRTRFENPLSTYLTSGRPTCSNKMTPFNDMCELLERDRIVHVVRVSFKNDVNQ